MNREYKTGQPAYMEFTTKDGYEIKGVFFVVSQDRYNLELREEEIIQIVSKRSIRVYDSRFANWKC